MGKHSVYVGVYEAAEILSVSTRTISRYIAAGYLDAGTLPGGKTLRLNRAQVIGCITPVRKQLP